MMYLLTYIIALIAIWCCIGYSMYHAPTDMELWGKELE